MYVLIWMKAVGIKATESGQLLKPKKGAEVSKPFITLQRWTLSYILEPKLLDQNL